MRVHAQPAPPLRGPFPVELSGALLRGIRHLLVSLLLATNTVSMAQRVTDANANLWVSHWGDHQISKRWSFHAEAHWRRADLGLNWQQLLLRPAVNFHLNEQVMLTQGYSYYINYGYGDHPIKYNNWEHHLFQQVQVGGHAVGRARLVHRFRMEERFIAKLIASNEDPTQGVI